jgi:hypothetical protein
MVLCPAFAQNRAGPSINATTGTPARIESDNAAKAPPRPRRPRQHRYPDDYDVLDGERAIGRIFRSSSAPTDRPWMWTITGRMASSDRSPAGCAGKAKTEKEAHGEFESEHPGYCGAQDTFWSFTASRSAKRCIVRSTNCKPILTAGSANTTRHDRTRDAGASAKRRRRPSLMQCR